MPTGKNLLYFIYVNLGFALYTVATYYITSIKEIKDNWPLYRCNPMYMPLSDNIETDFTYCIQNITTSSMGFLLQPLTFITDSLSKMAGNFMTEINSIRGMFDKIRGFLSSIIQSVMGIFLNLIIEFQKIIIGMKDLMGKTIGIVVSLLYVMDGSIKTMNSAWKGPSGQLVKALGKCFYPETKIKLKNGLIISIKDANLGDVLENGSIVYSTMKIDNKTNKEELYCIKEKGINKDNIHVTGSHLVFDKSRAKFVQVKDYSKATKSKIETDWFSCLITSDHKIQIGEETFWDWEDHFIKSKK
jgi:hypothetical protein